eukprot:TRINITY_DN86647_c0_g1_i1.p1 TRINITY_DN86647_c0_g1~~TRINITY_DN86647_c0_g1_i1.p1  ORF type:complete len:293 (-),score=31.63 TRINITY_DN86647_c0_g1_i1:62-910(-)
MASPMSPAASWSWHSKSNEEQTLYWTCVAMSCSFTVAMMILLLGVDAPYGRYNQGNAASAHSNPIIRAMASFSMNAKLAWILQECPTLISALICWVLGAEDCKGSLGNRALLLCFVLHYVNRSFIYPLRMKGSKPTPLPLMLMAMAFCAVNGYVQCRSLTKFVVIDVTSWTTPIGLLIWAIGLYINCDADHILRNLRKPGETGYKIPDGGMFKFISGANFFGEIVEWFGFAMAMGFALPGFTFAFCTACNIGPRAIGHHRWYLQKFGEEYPKQRKALIPFIF